MEFLRQSDLDTASVSQGDLAVIRSLGADIVRLLAGARLLTVRLRKGTLSPLVADFLRRLPSGSAPPAGAPVTLELAWRRNDQGVQLVLPWDSLGEREHAGCLVALLRLPALRIFWQRTLRRRRHDRLLRVLPRAWFVGDAPPPPGAVIPGLGVISKSNLPQESGLAVLRTGADEDAPALVAEIPQDAGPRLVATYEHMNSRVELVSISPAPVGW